MVYCTRKKVYTKKRSEDFKGRSYRNLDENKFKNDFLNLNWDDFEIENHPETLWNIYERNIRKIFDLMCPSNILELQEIGIRGCLKN